MLKRPIILILNNFLTYDGTRCILLPTGPLTAPNQGLKGHVSMTYGKITNAEYEELMRQVNRERALKAAGTRRERRWLERLYAMEDPRQEAR
jgi:hypothetical protein